MNLVPARYRVDIESSGFRRATHDQVIVEVQSAVRLDAALQVGDVEQTVEVSSQSPLLQTETTSLGQVVESRRVLEMPLNGRNVLSLVALVPGVVPQGLSQINPTGQNIFSVGNFQVGGGFGNQSATFIDGGPVNSFLANLTSMLPTQDAVQEFRVQTNNIGPEFGRFAGGVINMTTKSGTNEFHGSAYEFLRNKVLNANTFFNNRTGVGRPAFTQNQFGANLGGPIIKDKTFFFFGYEGFRLRQGRSYLFNVPTDAMRQGDFSALGTATGTQVPIYDPLTSCGALGNPACATGQTTLRTPFPGNKIPADRMDPAAQKLQFVYGRANLPGQPFTAIENFATNASIGGNNDQVNFRVDQNISDKQRLFGRYTRWSYLNLPFDPFQNRTHNDIGTEHVASQQAVIADTYTFSPNVVGDFRVAVLRYVYDRLPSSLGDDLTQYGLPAALNSQVTYRHIPVINVQNMAPLGGTGSIIYQFNDSFSLSPTFTVIRGRHTLKFGGEARRMTTNYAQSQNPSGTFSFDNRFTAGSPFSTGSTGFGYASFLLGYGFTGNVNSPAAYATAQYYNGYYISDTFQASRKLTLNYGVRWEPALPFTERFDRLTVLLPKAESPLAKLTGLPLKGRLGLVNSEDQPSRYGRRPHPRLFLPRLGFAYRVTDNTVVRGGYGIFIPPIYDILGGGSIGPLTNIVTDWVSTLDGSLTPVNRLSNPFPSGLNVPFGRNPAFQNALYGQNIGSNPVIAVPGEVERAGYFQQWNFNVQREFLRGSVFELAYAGSKGTHLEGPLNRNQVLPAVQALSVAELQRQVPNPFFGVVQIGTLSGATVAQGQLLRPFPQYGNVSGGDANRNSIYHAMQVRVQKRFSEGGVISGAYTWSKIITDRETVTTWLEGGQASTAIQDSYNLRAARAISSFDAAHRLVLSYIIDLPFGTGHKFMRGARGIAGKAISGWGVNGISTFQSGFPLGLTTANNLTNSFGGNSFPNSNGQSAKLTGPAQQRLGKWFEVADFSSPPASAFGNVGRVLPDVRMHGIANYDFSVFKNTPINERFRLQFRTEIFNLFNRVQFGRPGTALGLSTFGVVSSQANDPRLIQFALRLLY